MNIGRIILYVLWFCIPAFFFSLIAWAYLEKLSGKQSTERYGDLARSAFFALACVFLCIIIDQYFLESFYYSFSPPSIPLGFYQLILLPFVLLISAKLLGGSKPIRIERAPRPTQKASQNSKSKQRKKRKR